jgi:hypothetical protein
MDSLRHNSGPRRIAIGMIAVYALFLQGFFAAATHGTATELAGGPICSQAPAGTPATNRGGHHHGLCCVLACAACGCAYLSSDASSSVIPDCFASPVAWLSSQLQARCQPLSFRLGARGPPQNPQA